jgi:capping protein beta
MLTSKPQTGNINLSGSMTRQVEQELPLDPPTDLNAAHLTNMGRLIEDLEFKMRHALQEIYFGKTKDIVNDMRSAMSLSEKNKQNDVQRELAAKLTEKAAK